MSQAVDPETTAMAPNQTPEVVATAIREADPELTQLVEKY